MADGLDTTIAFILAIASVIIGVVLGVVAHRAYEAFRHRGRRIYQPRVFRGQFMKQKEFEQLHKELMKCDRIEVLSDDVRELVEDVWPELAHKLPPKTPHS